MGPQLWYDMLLSFLWQSLSQTTKWVSASEILLAETYSEDPIVIGLLGGQIIDGAMHGSDGASAPYLKMIIAAK
jgi:hypothetical protein